MTKLKIYNKDQSFLNQITLNGKDNFLKQMLNNNIQIYYGCQGGSCGACACTIINGKENIDTEAKKKAVFKGLEKGEFLPCIAKIKENLKGDEIIEIKKKL